MDATNNVMLSDRAAKLPRVIIASLGTGYVFTWANFLAWFVGAWTGRGSMDWGLTLTLTSSHARDCFTRLIAWIVFTLVGGIGS
jgi:hypothetical protein